MPSSWHVAAGRCCTSRTASAARRPRSPRRPPPAPARPSSARSTDTRPRRRARRCRSARAADSAAADSRRAAFRFARRGAGSPSETAGCCRECGEPPPGTSGPLSRGRRPARSPARAARRPTASPCRAWPCSRAPRRGPRLRTSEQIRSTTSAGDSGSPNTSIVFFRPASLTTSPVGASFCAAARSASAEPSCRGVDLGDGERHVRRLF